MPIKQVDTNKNGDVTRVFAEVSSGPRRGIWVLERKPELPEENISEPCWTLQHSPGYGELPSGGWYLRVADADYSAFASMLGARLSRAMFKRFGVTATRTIQTTSVYSNPIVDDAPVGREILTIGPNDWPGYVELVNGDFVGLDRATPEQLAEAAKLQSELANAHRDLGRKLRALSRGEIKLVESAP